MSDWNTLPLSALVSFQKGKKLKLVHIYFLVIVLTWVQIH